MPQSGYTLGRDVSFDMMTSYGPLRLPKLMSFKSKPVINKQKVVPLTGIADELQIPQGWEGTFEVERTDGTLDDFWAQWEADYFNGVDQGKGTITETISEVDGTLSVYRYQGVVLHLENPGDKDGEKTIKQSVAWTAQRRVKVN